MTERQVLAASLKTVVLVLLAAVTLGTRLPAPWRMDVINDEMYHLESWRNRYRTDNILPLFLRRLDETKQFTPQQKERLRKIYFSGPLVQRLLCIKSEYGTLGFGTMAEIIEAISKSNLIALRLPSVLFALGSIVLAYLLGKALWDDSLGLWIAALVAIGLLPQVYAGIGRAHGMTQFFLFAVLYMFIRERQNHYASPWRLFVVALLAQTAHITGWAVIGLVILSELIHRYREGASLGTLIRQTWWYAALSVFYLGLIAVSSINTSAVSANVGALGGISELWRNFCIGSPFGHLGAFGAWGLWTSGLLWVALIALGIVSLLRHSEGPGRYHWTFLTTLAVSLIFPFVAGPGVRHLMIFGVVPTIVAAIGARSLFRSPTASQVAVIGLLAVFGPLSFACKECSYTLIFPNEERFSQVANALAEAMGPGDIWVAYPYFLAYPIYHYRPDLPEPLTPLSLEEFKTALHSRPQDHSCFILTIDFLANVDPVLEEAKRQAVFRNRSILLELPPRSGPILREPEGSSNQTNSHVLGGTPGRMKMGIYGEW
jgi:hypothetical protein